MPHSMFKFNDGRATNKIIQLQAYKNQIHIKAYKFYIALFVLISYANAYAKWANRSLCVG